MKHIFLTASVLAIGAGGAIAGGIDRSGQSIAAIFEQGEYLELSFGYVSPTVSGVGTAFSTPGADSGDMAASYLQLGGAYKRELTGNLDLAIIFDQPFGANVDYPASSYFASGATAELKTSAITTVLNYSMASNFSVHAGVRVQSLTADASVPFVASYVASAPSSQGFGYVVGAAFEKPEIALRVALTYNSAIDHSLATTETSVSPLGGPNSSTTEVTTPQSVNLEFQSGVAADTLVFGSIRWVNWTAFDISPAKYATLTGGNSLVSFDNNTTTYSIGVGRRLNDMWSIAGTLGYEAQAGGFSSNLGPTDGNFSVGLGATYTNGNTKITGGIKYVKIGDAQTTLDDINAASNFTDNNAIGIGFKVGFTL